MKKQAKRRREASLNPALFIQLGHVVCRPTNILCRPTYIFTAHYLIAMEHLSKVG